jgi:hypothetical protein
MQWEQTSRWRRRRKVKTNVDYSIAYGESSAIENTNPAHSADPNRYAK